MRPTYIVVDEIDGQTFWRDESKRLFTRATAIDFAALRNDKRKHHLPLYRVCEVRYLGESSSEAAERINKIERLRVALDEISDIVDFGLTYASMSTLCESLEEVRKVVNVTTKATQD